MVEHNATTIAHLGMIQGIITRLETNSFALKAVAMTLAVAVLAFIGSVENPSWVYPMAGYFPLVVLWIMDAQYLRLGRSFRRLYNAVRQGEAQEPFSMDVEMYKKEEQSTLRIAFSWSILWFYLSIIIAFTVILFVALI